MTISDLGVLYANKEPTIVYAGTTWRWERSLSSQFPAATWTLDYYFRSSDGKYNFDIQATNNSGNFRVNYTSALSDDVAPTIYMG